MKSLGIVGTGLIARYIYKFLLATGWAVDDLVLFDSSGEPAVAFSRDMAATERHASVRFADSVTALLASCELSVFATTASAPYVSDPGAIAHRPVILHVSLRDLAPELLLHSWNAVDDVDHVMHANTSPYLAEQLSSSRDFVSATFAEVLEGWWRPDHSRPIIFSPFGLGVLDLAVGKWVYDRAVAAGKCHVIPDFLAT